MKKMLMILSVLSIIMFSQLTYAGWSFHYGVEINNGRTIKISDPSQQKCIEEVVGYSEFSTIIIKEMTNAGANCHRVSNKTPSFPELYPQTILCAINENQFIFVHWFENEKKCGIENMKNLFEQLKEKIRLNKKKYIEGYLK